MTMKSHDYMTFVLYPIPFNLEIFNEGVDSFPVKKPHPTKLSTSLPLSLSQELIEETSMNSALSLNEQSTVGLIIRRKIHSGKPLPKSY